jgi:hypothetical protein
MAVMCFRRSNVDAGRVKLPWKQQGVEGLVVWWKKKNGICKVGVSRNGKQQLVSPSLLARQAHAQAQAQAQADLVTVEENERIAIAPMCFWRGWFGRR